MSGHIRVEHATKKCKEQTVLNDICVDFPSGQTHGLIGRNGSGKTMLFKCICGFVPLTSGAIYIDDRQIGKELDVPQSIGIIIETPGFLPGYSAFRNLSFLASIQKKADTNRIREVIELVGLDPDSRKHVGKFSLGMRQRLGIAQAILENPDILLLDEPMNGLDNRGVADMRLLLQQLKREGKTILLASHNRDDIALLCDTVHEMDSGGVV